MRPILKNNLKQQGEDHTSKEPEEVVIDDISVYEEKPGDISEFSDVSQDEVSQLFSDEGIAETSSEDRKDEQKRGRRFRDTSIFA